MATLDLLADAAAGQSLLVVAEDVQWLDPGTVSQGVAGPALHLVPLDAEDSKRLLASVAPDLGEGSVTTILRAAEGNPLACSSCRKPSA